MSLYIVKNDDGNTMDYNGYFNFPISQTELFDEPNEPAKFAEELGGHVVELVEAPAKVVVSEEEAEMLEWAKGKTFPAIIFDSGAAGCLPGSQDRLMRAYVNGYTVAKEKKYIVKVPKKWSGDDKHYWIKRQNGSLTWVYYKDRIPAQQFTAEEIEYYGLQDCERVEINTEE